MTETVEFAIILIGHEESYWLLKGEDYLSAILSDEGYYPKPVKVITYPSGYELQLDLPDDIFTGSLWGIHPGIISRLRRHNDIIEEQK
ncbi:MAG: hypothetical protein JKY31_01385 [Rhodobacteraceae bacterium]|nr:hypothetical protein [Paracoccaceae bacterium]